MRHQREIAAHELRDGDRIICSDRYKYRVAGEVEIAARTDDIIFLKRPTLSDEDVAFRTTERLLVSRESE